MSELAKVITAVNIGYDSAAVTVECNITKGLPAFNIVGLADKAVGESRERVRAALANSGFTFPAKHITINLAPANLQKEGSHFDLPIAIGILIASGQLLQKTCEDIMLAGELGLNGELRPIRGALAIAECARKNGYKSIILPRENANQAVLLDEINIVGSTTLNEVILHLLGEKTLLSVNRIDVENTTSNAPSIDDVRGQEFAKRALVIAAAGHHNLLLSGSPGAGKTMLAKTLPGLLPPLTSSEIFETTKIYSLAGETDEIITERPFRAPHHTASFVALIGGGSKVKPGEISLAHNGVLFLDEIPEFTRSSLETLRQPLEDHIIHISRAAGKVTFPANFMLVATMNPCPCGYLGDSEHACTCTQQMIANYQKKISGPLLDRIDMVVPVARVEREKLFANDPKTAHEIDWKKQIDRAREIQTARQKQPNSSLPNKQLEKFAKLDTTTNSLLAAAAEKLCLSARGYFKILRVARTIADLANRENIAKEDIAEALQYRQNS